MCLKYYPCSMLLKNAIKMALLFPDEVIALYPCMYMQVCLCVCIHMCVYTPVCVHTCTQVCRWMSMGILDVYSNLGNAQREES